MKAIEGIADWMIGAIALLLCIAALIWGGQVLLAIPAAWDSVLQEEAASDQFEPSDEEAAYLEDAERVLHVLQMKEIKLGCEY